MALIDKLNNLGDAVRERSGATEKMTLEQMAQQVKDIPYPVVDEITIRENGKYTAPSGIDGYSEVVVDIPEIVCPVPVVEGITITENGTYTPNEGVDGFNEVVVDIPEIVCPECPEVEPPVIEALSITANGVYTAPSGIDGYSPITVNVPSGGGGGIEVEPIVLTGDCAYAFAGPVATNYVKLFGDTISTKNVYICDSMFKGYKNDIIPFDINCLSTTQVNLGNMFYEAGIKQLPRILNCQPRALNSLFYRCQSVREIPDDFCDTWDWSYLNSYSYGNCGFMFHECMSLRSISTNFLKNAYSAGTTSSYVYYYYCFSTCSSLDEINEWVIIPVTLTSNVFTNTFTNCYRLKNMTFETNEDGTPKTAQWKSQVIDFTTYVGYAYYSNYILKSNTGITADKEVKDDATYQALKNDPDWWTKKIEYSRYNHDSAVNTINSLPDTSAYGTNTIKFLGASGSLTDGGAINTLTEEEIAVAAAKGWTVTFV
jgi:hypothetical protein